MNLSVFLGFFHLDQLNKTGVHTNQFFATLFVNSFLYSFCIVHRRVHCLLSNKYKVDYQRNNIYSSYCMQLHSLVHNQCVNIESIK